MLKILGCVLLLAATQIAVADTQENCTASLIWHEARSQPSKVKTDIVIEVTFNRAADTLVGGYAASGSKVSTRLLDICAVIHKRGQYQWVKHQTLVPSKELEAWESARALARQILEKPHHVVSGRRFFNNKSIGKIHKTKNKPLVIADMMAY